MPTFIWLFLHPNQLHSYLPKRKLTIAFINVNNPQAVFGNVTFNLIKFQNLINSEHPPPTDDLTPFDVATWECPYMAQIQGVNKKLNTTKTSTHSFVVAWKCSYYLENKQMNSTLTMRCNCVCVFILVSMWLMNAEWVCQCPYGQLTTILYIC